MDMMNFLFVLLVLSVSARTSGAEGKESQEPCENINTTITSEKICFLKAEESLIYSFSSVRIEITLNCSGCEVLHGPSLKDVTDSKSTWNGLLNALTRLFSTKKDEKDSRITVLHLSPYENKYIKIQSRETTNIEMKIITIRDVRCIALLLSGLLLYFSAPNMSTSVKFYYTGGTGIGILASLLIIIFILSRLVPTKPAAYSILIGGWSFGAWLMTVIWNNWQSILVTYKTYFLVYVAVAGFLSFAICYWKGPVEDQRSQHIIQGAIRLFALLLIYSGSQSTMVSVTIVFCVVVGSLFKSQTEYLARWDSSFIRKYIWRRKLEPRKLLTEEEYRTEAEVETRKALEELKEYCNSPQCSPWKTLSRIKSPQKLINFMDGGRHVSDGEMTLHENDVIDSDTEETNSLITDDERTPVKHLGGGDNNFSSIYPSLSEDEF